MDRTNIARFVAILVSICSSHIQLSIEANIVTNRAVLIDEIHANGGTVSLLDFGGGFPAFYEKNIGPRSNSMLEFAATY